MHILGKISAWLTVIAAGAALGLTAKLYDVRGGWQAQATTLKEGNEKNAVTLETSRKGLGKAQAELASELVRWEKYWTDVPAAFAAQGAGGTLSADIGTAQGLGTELNPKPVVHAFQLAEDGTPTYVGPFQVVESRENQSVLKPVFRVRADEPATWTSQKWRFRAAVPDVDKTKFLDLETQLATADERLLKEKSNLLTQSQLVDTSKQHRDFRMAELLGAPNQSPGLVANIEKAEAARDEAISIVDELRRAISAAVARLNELAAGNRELIEKLTTTLKSLPNETADARRD